MDAADLAEAPLEFAGDGPFYLLLADLTVPGGSGTELCAQDDRMKGLLITGYSRSMLVSLGGPVLEKPFRRNELLDA